MAQGWISISRKIKEHWLYQEERSFSRYEAWIDLLFLVNHKDNKFLHDGELIEIKRGSTITSLRRLSESWGWSTTKTKKFLGMLQLDKMITYKSNTKKTLLTVINYGLWQSGDKEKKHRSNTEVTQKKHRSNTEVTQKKTNNNDKQCLNNDLIMNNNEKEVNILEQVKDLWNNQTINSKIKVLSKKRKEHLKNRITEIKKEVGEDGIIGIFEETIKKINNSLFCTGKNKQGWKADFDFIIANDTNIWKILEGKYDDKDMTVNDKTARDLKTMNEWLNKKEEKEEKEEKEVEQC